MTREQEFISHYKRFHDYMDKSSVLLYLYPNAHQKEVFRSWVESVPREIDCIIECLNVTDPRVLRILKEWETPCKNRDLAHEIVDQNVQCHFVADITYLFWRYADVVHHLRAEYDSRESNVLLEQTIVTSCTAYECFLKEMIAWILGHNRECARRFLGSIGKPIKDLGKYDFDPLSHVTAIYHDTRGNKIMPVFPDVVDFYHDTLKITLFDDADHQKDVERIFQIRHCIVHNAGKPDEQWRRKEKSESFRMDLESVEGYFKTIHDALHQASSAIYKAMGLDDKLAPWTYEGDVMVCKLSEIEERNPLILENLGHKAESPNKPDTGDGAKRD
jgi:hypothetical protein